MNRRKTTDPPSTALCLQTSRTLLLQRLRERCRSSNPKCVNHSSLLLGSCAYDTLQTLSLSSLDTFVIDEADLILSYGHDQDVRQIFSGGYLPKVFQSFLMSATMTEDVEILKGLALRNPVSAECVT